MDRMEKKMDKLAEEQDVKVRLISLYWTNEINRSSSLLEDSAPEEYCLQLPGDKDWIRLCEEGRGKPRWLDEGVQRMFHHHCPSECFVFLVEALLPILLDY